MLAHSKSASLADAAVKGALALKLRLRGTHRLNLQKVVHRRLVVIRHAHELFVDRVANESDFGRVKHVSVAFATAFNCLEGGVGHTIEARLAALIALKLGCEQNKFWLSFYYLGLCGGGVESKALAKGDVRSDRILLIEEELARLDVIDVVATHTSSFLGRIEESLLFISQLVGSQGQLAARRRAANIVVDEGSHRRHVEISLGLHR